MFRSKDEKTDKDFNLLELSINNNTKAIISPLMIKLILILLFILVIFLIIGVTIFTIINQLNIIKGLTSQVQDLSSQIISDIPILKTKVNDLVLLTNQINKVELLLTEKDKEIQSLKEITNNLILTTYNLPFEKDKNFKIFMEKMKNLNYLKDFNMEKINFIEKELKNNRDEILLLKDIIKNLNIIDNYNFTNKNIDEKIMSIKPDIPDGPDDINTNIENNELKNN